MVQASDWKKQRRTLSVHTLLTKWETSCTKSSHCSLSYAYIEWDVAINVLLLCLSCLQVHLTKSKAPIPPSAVVCVHQATSVLLAPQPCSRVSKARTIRTLLSSTCPTVIPVYLVSYWHQCVLGILRSNSWSLLLKDTHAPKRAFLDQMRPARADISVPRVARLQPNGPAPLDATRSQVRLHRRRNASCVLWGWLAWRGRASLVWTQFSVRLVTTVRW